MTDLTRHDGGLLTLDILSNTPGGAYDGYQVVSVHRNAHKVIAIKPNGVVMTEFYDSVNKNNYLGTYNEYNPDPVYGEWDAAQAVGNITLSTKLSKSDRKLYMFVWFYGFFMSPELQDLYNNLQADGTLSVGQRKRIYSGGCRGWGVTKANASAMADIRFDNDKKPKYADTGLLKMSRRFERLLEEMGRVTIEE